jgi:hypothetical protein
MSVQDSEILRIYEIAIDELEISFRLSQEPAGEIDVVDVVMWIWVIPDSSLALLKAQTQEAVAIFAHSCILLNVMIGYGSYAVGWQT